jgi:hypothetical protein
MRDLIDKLDTVIYSLIVFLFGTVVLCVIAFVIAVFVSIVVKSVFWLLGVNVILS